MAHFNPSHYLVILFKRRQLERGRDDMSDRYSPIAGRVSSITSSCKVTLSNTFKLLGCNCLQIGGRCFLSTMIMHHSCPCAPNGMGCQVLQITPPPPSLPAPPETAEELLHFLSKAFEWNCWGGKSFWSTFHEVLKARNLVEVGGM